MNGKVDVVVKQKGLGGHLEVFGCPNRDIPVILRASSTQRDLSAMELIRSDWREWPNNYMLRYYSSPKGNWGQNMVNDRS